VLRVGRNQEADNGQSVTNADKPNGEIVPNETILDADELGRLVAAFKGHPLFAVVAFAAASGARRNEIFTLRWIDIDFATGMVSITRNIEDSRELGRHIGTPKTKRGRRAFQIDEHTLAVLKRERERWQRVVAGVPDGIDVDLSLVKLPPDALCFPAADGFDLTALRSPVSAGDLFSAHAAKLGFPGITLHDLRASHETALLDAGVSVHVVAARCGHDPATLLRYYARRTKKSDTNAAGVIGGNPPGRVETKLSNLATRRGVSD
jgi:integrase